MSFAGCCGDPQPWVEYLCRSPRWSHFARRHSCCKWVFWTMLHLWCHHCLCPPIWTADWTHTRIFRALAAENQVLFSRIHENIPICIPAVAVFSFGSLHHESIFVLISTSLFGLRNSCSSPTFIGFAFEIRNSRYRCRSGLLFHSPCRFFGYRLFLEIWCRDRLRHRVHTFYWLFSSIASLQFENSV